MEAPLSVTQRRRAVVEAIMSPPTTEEGLGKKLKESIEDSCKKVVVKCTLCHYSEESSQYSKEGRSLSSFVGSTMRQFGLTFGEEGEEMMTFCSFCHTHMNHLVSLKKEMDEIGQRISSVVLGLHALISKTEEEDDKAGGIEVVRTEDKKGLTQTATARDDNVEDISDPSTVPVETSINSSLLVVPSPGHQINNPVMAVLKNMDLLQIILSKVKKDSTSNPFPELRLVCRDFNNAVLTMPYPPPICLQLNKMFPEKCKPGLCLDPSPFSVEEIPYLSSEELCRNVKMRFNNDCSYRRHEVVYEGELGHFPDPMAVEAVTFLNFCIVYGVSIKILKLERVEEAYILALTIALDRHCPNLRDLAIDGYNLSTRTYSNDHFSFSRNDNLRRLEFSEDDSYAYCPRMRQMAKIIVEGSPNLEELVCHSEVVFDLTAHKKLKCISHRIMLTTSFRPKGLMDMLLSSAGTIEKMKMYFDLKTAWNSEAVETLKDFRLIPMPRLRKLEVSFPRMYNFGKALAACIFDSRTSQMYSLTIRSDHLGAMDDFLKLIGNNFSRYRNETVTKLEVNVPDSGIRNITHFSHLKTAFPNLKILKLKTGLGRDNNGIERGSENLTHVFNALSLWKQLRDVDLKVSFPFSFSSLLSALVALGKGFWELGSIRSLRLEVKEYASLFPRPPFFYSHDEMEEALRAMKPMDKVTFANFVMPASVTEELLAFISANDLPVSFIDGPAGGV